MDRQKAKKLRNIRVIATNIFMSICVVAIVFILMLIAMGFSFNESGKLEQSGLLQISSRPGSASVEIDNESQHSRTDFSKMLRSGEHKVRITKEGYGEWQKTVRIDAGLLTRIGWVRLFPNNPEIKETVSFKNIRLASFSTNRKNLLSLEENSTTLKLYNIQDDDVRARDIALEQCLSTSKADAVQGSITVIAWSSSNSKLIAKWTVDDKTSWHLIDLENPDNSVNLSKRFNLNFDSILIANDSANKLWIIENGNLRMIDAQNLTISGAIASNLVKIANNHETVAFVSTKYNESDNTTKYQLNVYRDGEEGFTTVANLDQANDDSTIRLAMGSYWNEDWLAYSINQNLIITSGKYPNYKKDAKSLEERLNQQLSYTPQFISVNPNHRVVVLSGEQTLTSYDIETKDLYNAKLTADVTSLNWIDDFILWQNVDNSIVVRDFDGDNRRTIVNDINNSLPVIISENNRWLYYFAITESETVSGNNNSPSDAAPSENVKTNITYTLKRKKLE